MKKVKLLLVCVFATGCASEVQEIGMPRPEILMDVEGYAVASCLTMQVDTYLKDQGDGWASVIIQRMRGDLDSLTSIVEEVRRENSVGEMAIIRVEGELTKDKALPILYCSEIINKPAVRLAIRDAVSALLPSYKQ